MDDVAGPTFARRPSDAGPSEEGITVILRFASCELDVGRVVLRRDGSEVRVEPQVFDLLAYLALHRGKLVRKEELLDEIWGDRFVSESALTTRIKSLRQAVGDDGTRQAIVRTVHGKGYEFVAPVVVVDEPADERSARESWVGAGLPVTVQALVGRESLLAVLVEAAATHRLVTLVGPGGVGKTSLAFELARGVAPRYPDGVTLVELVSVVDEDATLDAVATSIDVNVRRSSSIEDAILEMLRPRECLLVLDNCEHLIEPVAALVSRVLREAPLVSVLATSREPLAVPGEHVWLVEPLSTAGADDDIDTDPTSIPAVALFVERARAADPSFVLDEETAPVVVEICRRLDGIPLAIELAAARARTIGVAEIARRLDERFGLLKAMRRGSDPRHRAMHDAISWSYDMLEPDEQELFTALSVFAGTFDLTAAGRMCASGDALDLLTRLAERSMLTVRRHVGGDARYELLETLRDYGRARLADEHAAELYTEHASHFAAEAAIVARDLHGPAEMVGIERAEASFADMRSAQRFALDVGALDAAFGIIASLREFGMRAMRYEVFAWADVACRVPGALEHPVAPTLTGMHAYGAWVRGEFDLAVELANETRRLEQALGTAPSGLVERVLGNVLYIVGRSDLGNEEAARQVQLAEESGDKSRLVHACYMAAVALSSIGESDGAAELVRRAHSEAVKTSSPTDLASAAVAEGFLANSSDDALEAFVAADRLARSGGNRWMSAFARTEASGLLVHRGEVGEGCAGLAETVGLWYRAGEWSQQWHTLSRCMIALHRIGQTELAVELLGAIEAHAMLAVAPMSSTLHNVVLVTRDALLEGLGTDRADELRSIGGSCPVEDIVHRTRKALLARPI
jgi:predicted ATPase/DNA-binding winged helix-turn-helix (wHTH) protein